MECMHLVHNVEKIRTISFCRFDLCRQARLVYGCVSKQKGSKNDLNIRIMISEESSRSAIALFVTWSLQSDRDSSHCKRVVAMDDDTLIVEAAPTRIAGLGTTCIHHFSTDADGITHSSHNWNVFNVFQRSCILLLLTRRRYIPTRTRCNDLCSSMLYRVAPEESHKTLHHIYCHLRLGRYILAQRQTTE